MKKLPLIFCGLSLLAAAIGAYGQGELLPIAPPEPTPQAFEVDRARLAYLERAAGLTALRGPGVVVTLRDRKNANQKNADLSLVHDYDLTVVVNQLRAAQAEAIAINGVRVGSQTAIRVVGASIKVGEQNLQPPFRIEAIGDGALLKKFLVSSGFAATYQGSGPQMSVAIDKNVRVPALEQEPTFRFGSPE